ncbi:hypothetical protein U1Q18_009543, partial [Sarracenia purpurea var. burkii]
MEDDNKKVAIENQLPHEFSNDFLGDLLLNSLVESVRFAEIVDHPDSCKSSNSSSSPEEERYMNGVLPHEESTRHGDDAISKKKQRQLRNRDVPMRSRERKK